jgi:hypothetical protein
VQKERVPINIVVATTIRKELSMTDGSVAISITIKVEDVVMEFEEKVPIDAVEESVNSLSTGLGQQVLQGVIRVLDDRIAWHVPADWRNVGTEKRWMVSSLGAVRYRRRVYQDEQRMRRKPIDDLFELPRYGRMSGRVQEMGASLASCETYRFFDQRFQFRVGAGSWITVQSGLAEQQIVEIARPSRHPKSGPAVPCERSTR